MSEVILYGTLPNGEAVRVEANESGQLVAEGLQGQPGDPGQPGQPGPPGPPGPPGDIYAQLPPDPYDGAVLGWMNDELAWLGEVVILPQNTIGPITEYDLEAGTLSYVEGEPDYFIADGDIFMSNAFGDRITYRPVSDVITKSNGKQLTFAGDAYLRNGAFKVGDLVGGTANQDEVWSNYLSETDQYGPTGAFDGRSDSRASCATSGCTLTFTPPGGLAYTSSVRAMIPAMSNENRCYVQLNDEEPVESAGSGQFTTVATGSGVLNTLSTFYTPAYASGFYEIEVDGRVLIDPQFPDPGGFEIIGINADNKTMDLKENPFVPGQTVTGQVQSPDGVLLLDASASKPKLIMKRDSQGWRVGDFVTTPERALARRMARKVTKRADYNRRLK